MIMRLDRLIAGAAKKKAGEELEVPEKLYPEGALAYDLPSQPAVFAPGPN